MLKPKHIGSFLLIFVLLVAMVAGIFYWRDEDRSVPDSMEKNCTRFVHPIQGYFLDLPCEMIGKTFPVENSNRTDFWYENNSEKLLLFSIVRQDKNVLPTGHKSALLGERSGEFFFLIAGGEDFPQRNKIWTAISSDKSFGFIQRDRSSDIARAIALLETPKLNEITFSTCETIATQENATTTDYYVWFLRRKFAWSGSRLRDWPVESVPASVVVDTEGNVLAVTSAPTPALEKKVFPSAIRLSRIFSDKTEEHAAMLSKLEERLAEKVADYFGNEPVITRAGYLQGVKAEDDGVELKIVLADTSASSTETALPAKPAQTGKSFYLSSSSAQIVMRSSTSPQMFTVPVGEITQIFKGKSISEWRKRPFWFDLQNGSVLKITEI